MNQQIKESSSLIVKKRSGIHGYGLFARQDIHRGVKIIEYVGDKITKKESDRRGDSLLKKQKIKKNIGTVYIFDLNTRYDLDGNVSWNIARHINHSCEPNCEAQQIRGHIWIVSKRKIAKGEELSYDYGYGFESYHDHRCECGKKKCVGYIVAREHWHRLKRRHANIKK
jgi:uncharacterized protein